MLINNKKVTEELTISQAVTPTVSAAVSSSALVDMQDYRKFVAEVSKGVTTTAGSLVVTIYESTASTWNGAVAVLLSTSTVATVTGSAYLENVEIDVSAITEGKRYLGVYVTQTDTASAVSTNVIRAESRF